MKQGTPSKATLFLFLALFFVAALLYRPAPGDKPQATTPISDLHLNAVFAEMTSTEKDITSTPATTAATAPETQPCTQPEKATEALAVIAPAPEILPPDLPYVTGLPDTPPIALTPDPPMIAPPILVTGLPDTPPIDVPIEVPSVIPTLSEGDTHAAYIATAYRLDFPKSTTLTAKTLTDEIETIVKGAKTAGINTLFFQVRPASDAFYDSSIFPTSRYLVKNEGDIPPIDVLSQFVKAAHREGIALHAWINPYRITSKGESIFQLFKENPALKHPEYTFTVDGALYYNPALDEVIALIVNGIREIIENYDVDGILFDDYFYPEGMTNEDVAFYTEYRDKGGTLSLYDWRRENVNRLVRECYRAIKATHADISFGIAPRGIWRNVADDPLGSMTSGSAAYDAIYCDALAWVREGTVDYLAPQLYWSYHEERAQFVTLALWWEKMLNGSGVAYLPSLAAYRLSEEELRAQIYYLSHLPNCRGYALYRLSHLY